MATSASPALKTTALAGTFSVKKYPSFTPRVHFDVPTSLPRSYFLGHHRTGLEKMKSLLGSIDLVIECRDYRVPWTGRNALFEKELGLGSSGGGGTGVGSTKRVIVFTKWDLGNEDHRDSTARKRDSLLRRLHHPTPVHFSSAGSSTATTESLLNVFREFARESFSLTGHRVLVAGMPNVGKSTLLNALRAAGLPGRSKGKVAKTGADPGVTRKVATGVKILDAEEPEEPEGDDLSGIDTDGSKPASAGDAAGKDKGTGKGKTPQVSGSRAKRAAGEGVYLLDTPGVFMPYVPSATAMLKLALVGAVKDSIISPVTLADFLLYNINLRGDPAVYTYYAPNKVPTNDVLALLECAGRKTGRLAKGGVVDVEAAAIWLVQRWRQGLLGRFVLDDVDDRVPGQAGGGDGDGGGDGGGKELVSVNQARKLERDRRSKASKAKRLSRD